MESPAFTALRFEVTDGIALLTIDVPGRPMNVLTPELKDELSAAVKLIAASPEIKGASLRRESRTASLPGRISSSWQPRMSAALRRSRVLNGRTR